MNCQSSSSGSRPTGGTRKVSPHQPSPAHTGGAQAPSRRRQQPSAAEGEADAGEIETMPRAEHGSSRLSLADAIAWDAAANAGEKQGDQFVGTEMTVDDIGHRSLTVGQGAAVADAFEALEAANAKVTHLTEKRDQAYQAAEAARVKLTRIQRGWPRGARSASIETEHATATAALAARHQAFEHAETMLSTAMGQKRGAQRARDMLIEQLRPPKQTNRRSRRPQI